MNRLQKLVTVVGWGIAFLLVAVGSAWAFGAIWFDLPWAGLRKPVAVTFLVAVGLAVWRGRSIWARAAWPAAGCLVVLGWWLTLRPRNDRDWQPEVDRTAWAEVTGDTVTIHNVRNYVYRTESDFTPGWESRTVQLSQLTGVDIALTTWGSGRMTHPIVSFQFAEGPPIAFSIETRKEVGESYSSLGGLYRRFELIYIAADERDVIRARTSIRKGETVWLYHITLGPAEARQRFLEYVQSLNALHAQPRWYNAITTNCTTAIRAQHPSARRAAWDWRILLNGRIDELFYERGAIVSDGLSFADLKQGAQINEAGTKAGTSPDFSHLIRRDRPGFPPPPGH